MSVHLTEPPPAQVRRLTDAVICGTCGRTIKRASRHQRFCGDRCREKNRSRTRKAGMASPLEFARTGDFEGGLGGYTSAPRHPPKKRNEFSRLQAAKTGTTPPVFGPAHIVEAELFGGRWERTVSSDGVVSFVRPKVRP